MPNLLPHATTIVESLLAARRRAGQLLLGLDYDGTLAPIVPDPDDAFLAPDVSAVLKSLAQRSDTTLAILSGRGLADLEQRVGLEHVYYAGNHGLEVEGVDVHFVHELAEAARPLLAELAQRLTDALTEVPLTRLEFKGLTLSVHYRRVHDEPTAARVRALVAQTCAPYPGLHVSHGKKVVEVRPDVDWHKGEALRLLRDLITARAADAPIVFIGDDRTDEDGFRLLHDEGCGIVVGNPPREDTAARAFLRSPGEVAAFLRRLAEP